MSASRCREDVAEADQHRQADAAELQVVDQLLQVDGDATGPWSGGPGRDRCAPTEK